MISRYVDTLYISCAEGSFDTATNVFRLSLLALCPLETKDMFPVFLAIVSGDKLTTGNDKLLRQVSLANRGLIALNHCPCEIAHKLRASLAQFQGLLLLLKKPLF